MTENNGPNDLYEELISPYRKALVVCFNNCGRIGLCGAVFTCLYNGLVAVYQEHRVENTGLFCFEKNGLTVLCLKYLSYCVDNTDLILVFIHLSRIMVSLFCD